MHSVVSTWTPSHSVRSIPSFVLVLLLTCTWSSLLIAAQSRRAAGRPLPRVSWTCPMHPEVVDDTAGDCPICKMKLVPVRLELVWTCPTHTDVAAHEAGKCPTCRRDLVRVIKAMSWTCRVHPKVDEINPGRCPICRRPLTVKYSDRPHGDHNPKHGGYFIMAPNNWHVEATHPSRGVFRVYAYDEYSKPFLPHGFAARLGVIPQSGRGVAPEPAIAFRRVANRPYFEARVPYLELPAFVVVKVRFQANEPEYRFDFQFHDYSKEPAATR